MTARKFDTVEHHDQLAGRTGSRSDATVVGTDGQDLVDPHPAVAERHRATDEVEPPDAGHLLADEGDDLVEVVLEGAVPRGHGAHVVLAQGVHVAHLEARTLDEVNGFARPDACACRGR